MQIIIANQQEINPEGGGIERVSWGLALDWISKGHNVSFVSSFPFQDNINSNISKIPQYFLPNGDEELCDENKQYIESLLEELHIDIILNQSAHINDFSQLLFNCNRGKTKIVSVLHFNPDYFLKDIKDSFFDTDELKFNILKWTKEIIRFIYYNTYRYKQINKSYSRLYHNVYTSSDIYVLLSKEYITSFVKYLATKDHNKLYAISNPIFLQNNNLNSGLDKENIILYVGRLVKSQKRPDRLINIWREVYKDYPDWKLVILGDGGYRKKLENMVSRSRIQNVEFKGFQSPEKYYSNSSILCMTSSFEGLPLVLIEAQYAGCIPIAYGTFESIKDIIQDKINGYIINPYNKKRYISELRNLMDNKDLRKKLSVSCIESVDKFNIEKIGSEWIELFNKISAE